MTKTLVFAGRCRKEIMRDPLSYMFCLGFPVVLLIVFQVILKSSGGSAQWFELDHLTPGIMIFSYAFVSLYMSLLVSKDRTTSLLTRLYTSPMKTADFVLGYSLPGIAIAIGQALICWVAAFVTGLVTDCAIDPLGALLSVAVSIPAAVMFVFMGILCGAAFSERSAPGITSVFINLAGFCSGAWMPMETMTGFANVCMFMPFYPATRICRAAYSGTFGDMGAKTALLCTAVTVGYAIAVALLSVLIFRKKSKE